MTRNRLFVQGKLFLAEDHESALIEEGERRVQELFEHQFSTEGLGQSQPLRAVSNCPRMFHIECRQIDSL